jgi:MtN3 and saliva related transmembrane protein
MKFSLFDQNVSTTMNVFIIIANIINLVYNLPQIYKTYKTKSTKDFSEWFLLLRVVGNVIWIPYSIEINSMLLLINTLVTVLASIFIGYYKVKEIINKKKFELYLQISNNEVEYVDNDEKIISV